MKETLDDLSVIKNAERENIWGTEWGMRDRDFFAHGMALSEIEERKGEKLVYFYPKTGYREEGFDTYLAVIGKERGLISVTARSVMKGKDDRALRFYEDKCMEKSLRYGKPLVAWREEDECGMAWEGEKETVVIEMRERGDRTIIAVSATAFPE